MPAPRSSHARSNTKAVEPFHLHQTLGLDGRNAVTTVRRIRKGLSFRSLVNLQKATDFSWKDICRLVSIPARTLSRRQREGKLHPDESDRVLRASAIFNLTLRLFEGDVPGARKWLRTRQPALGGETPLEFASTQVGAREVENLIGRLEHGVFT